MWKCINSTVYAQVSALDMTLSLKWSAPSATDAEHIFAKSLMEIFFCFSRTRETETGFQQDLAPCCLFNFLQALLLCDL